MLTAPPWPQMRVEAPATRSPTGWRWWRMAASTASRSPSPPSATGTWRRPNIILREAGAASPTATERLCATTARKHGNPPDRRRRAITRRDHFADSLVVAPPTPVHTLSLDRSAGGRSMRQSKSLRAARRFGFNAVANERKPVMAKGAPKQLLHLVFGGEPASTDSIEFKDAPSSTLSASIPISPKPAPPGPPRRRARWTAPRTRYFVVHIHHLMDPDHPHDH